MRLTLPLCGADHGAGRGHLYRVSVRYKPGGPPAVLAPQPRPLIGYVSVLVDVPVRTAGMPHGGAQRHPQLTVEFLGGGASDLDDARILPVELAQRGDHVIEPGLDRV